MRSAPDRLPALVWRHVADIGHRNRNYPAGNRAGGKPRQGELRKRRAHAAQRHEHRRQYAGDGDQAKFAEAVGDRSGNELNEAVRNGVSGDDNCRDADGGVEIDGDLRQERIGDANLRLTGETGGRQQNDGSRRRLARGGGGGFDEGRHVAGQLKS